MIATQEHGTLREATIGSDFHVFEVVNPHLFTDPTVLANFQKPRVFNVHAGFNNHSTTYFRAENAQQEAFKRRKWEKRIDEEKRVHNKPKCAQHRGTRLVPGVVESAEVSFWFHNTTTKVGLSKANISVFATRIETVRDFAELQQDRLQFFFLKFLRPDRVDRIPLGQVECIASRPA